MNQNQGQNLNHNSNSHKNNICNNCGKQGHLFHQCKLPITSYGIILYRKIKINANENEKEQYKYEYLMIRRKDSFGYIGFLRGKYIQHNAEQLQNMFDEMSVVEKDNIRNNNFETLWKQMWGETYVSSQYKSEESISQKKFDILRHGIVIKSNTSEPVNCFKNGLNETSKEQEEDKDKEKEQDKEKEKEQDKDKDKDKDKEKEKEQDKDKEKEKEKTPDQFISLDTLINKSTTAWKETEWEFPKGRRNYQEKDLDCAIREFEEETGISKYNIKIIENLMPFEEIFIGSNHKSYKHKYFLAAMCDQEEKNKYTLNNYQKTEVSKIKWKTLEECLESIRPYNLEKKQLILNINTVLQEYKIF
jgi:8-oxo-dGTP pyrophosphatase MutT (NUDIX family)